MPPRRRQPTGGRLMSTTHKEEHDEHAQPARRTCPRQVKLYCGPIRPMNRSAFALCSPALCGVFQQKKRALVGIRALTWGLETSRMRTVLTPAVSRKPPPGT